jgi:multidrug efflux pump subunit AcrA (membrane-fusion protein)
VGKKPDSTSSTYPLTLILEKTAGDVVRPGMAANVRIGISARDETERFVVPVQALFNHGGKRSLVWVFDSENSVVRQQAVFVRNLAAEGVEITGELTPGQWIVTAGVHHLQDGQKVRLLINPSETNLGEML